MTEPKAYLSVSDGMWRVIVNGSPICADTTRERAEECARQMRVVLPSVVWNGDKGCFEETAS